MKFTDFGDEGTYTGDLSNGKRHGVGKMVYDSGNTYEGGFKDNLMHGKGLYTWIDGDSQSSNWSASKRNGPSIFYATNGEVEYSTYVNDVAVGSGVIWSADRTKAYRLSNGNKDVQISLGMAEKIAKEYGLDVPKISEVKVEKRLPKSGLMTWMFASSYVDGDGNLRFKDHGMWGTYVGDIDADGKREGRGKITYDEGSSYDGEYTNNKADGKGLYVWEDGEEYEGEWKDGERHGKGIYRKNDGVVEYSIFLNGKPIGNGVMWTADRKNAYGMKDGVKNLEMLPEEAETFAKEVFGLSVPKVTATKPPPVQRGLLARLFGNRPTFDKDGKLMFKDNGDWGTWSGEVDFNNKRYGFGTMTYKSGSVYEGGFLNDVYDDESGKSKYTWYDGESYVGQWKHGERDGKGVFCSSDGSVEYSMYQAGRSIGQGLKWSADRKSAFRLVDGKQSTEISCGVAEKEAKKMFGLPVPEASVKPTSLADKDHQPSQPGLFQRIFKGAPPLDEEGNPMFRDNSDWGSYIGERDANGHRSGKGKMTYQSGAVYEGDFRNNKYEGQGIYTWDDGCKYNGAWKDGERTGKSTFTHADGTLEMNICVNGTAIGEGIRWSPDGKSAWKLIDGEKTMEMLPEEAHELATKKFTTLSHDFPKVAPKDPATAKAVKGMPGLFSRLWNKYDAEGKLMYKDYGDWGSWTGDLDWSGKRTGKGIMTYEAGTIYEGEFVNDKYEGYGKYTWDDSDSYEGDWKDGERHGKGIFRSGDGTVQYSMYDNGRSVGEGVSWSPDRKKAFLLNDGDVDVEISLEEAEKFCEEKFELPVPAYYEPTKETSGGFFGFFQSSKRLTPTSGEAPKLQNSASSSIVESWLKSELPNLNPSDLQTYSKQLVDDGYDSVEMLNYLQVGDLGFMKKAHQRVLVEKLKVKR